MTPSWMGELELCRPLALAVLFQVPGLQTIVTCHGDLIGTIERFVSDLLAIAAGFIWALRSHVTNFKAMFAGAFEDSL